MTKYYQCYRECPKKCGCYTRYRTIDQTASSERCPDVLMTDVEVAAAVLLGRTMEDDPDET